jgi:very-short-patch-repair endonuclease
MIENREFGWTARKDLSFPEKIYKEFFEKNGFENQFEMNYLIYRKEGCYFLDFYFPEMKLDIEIDGQQHERLDRKTSDIKRDSYLKEKGIKVVRIKWKSISKEEGKEYLKNQQNQLLKILTLDN